MAARPGPRASAHGSHHTEARAKAWCLSTHAKAFLSLSRTFPFHLNLSRFVPSSHTDSYPTEHARSAHVEVKRGAVSGPARRQMMRTQYTTAVGRGPHGTVRGS